MLRKLALATAISAVTMGTHFAHAVGLGEITLNSHLNEPLNAEIKLLSVEDLSKNELLPNLASHEDFDRAGVERVFFLTGIKFDVQKQADGTAVIKLQTSKIVREPYLNFLVELHWPTGRLLREYTIFLDPPIFTERAAAPVITQAPATTPSPNRAPQPSKQPAATSSTTSAVNTRSTSGANQQGGDTIRVKKNDTLWNIAAKVRPGRDVTIRQTMLALQRQNQHAFINNNINLLKAGAVLRTPSLQDVRTVSNDEARGEVARQTRAWRDKQTTLDATQDDVLAYGADDSAAADSSGQLKLVTDDFAIGDDAQAGGFSQEGNGGLGDGVAASGGSEGGSTGAQTAALEQEVDNLKRIIMLQNQKLELLQKSIEQSANDSGNGTNQSAEQQLTEVSDALNDAEATALSGAADAGESANLAAAEETATESSPEPVAKTESAGDAEQSLLDRLTNNPLYIGLAVLVGLVVLGIIGLVSRRKEDESYPDDLRQVLDHDQVDLPDDVVEPAAAAPAAPAGAGVAEDDIAKAIEEADVYINYGRHERAVELLEPAIAANPDNSELHLKLAEVYAATGDASGLAQQESTLENLGDEDALVALAAMKAKYAADAEPTFANVESFEEDTLADLPPVEPSASEEPSADQEASADEALSASIEPEVEVTGETAEEAAAQDDNVLDFELPDSEAPEVAAATESAQEAVADTEEVDADDMAFLEDADEAATKLELARAYIDMADADAAQEILQEVIAEGNDTQKSEAEQLLQNLG